VGDAGRGEALTGGPPGDGNPRAARLRRPADPDAGERRQSPK